MGLKILHTADWHLDSPLTSLPESQREQLRRRQRRLPGTIADVCIREGCDLVLLAGDIFDGKPARESVDSLRSALARCRVPVLISPGNHDYVEADSLWSREKWPENVHIFDGSLTALDLPQLSCRVYGAGYRSMDCPPLLEGFWAEGDARFCIGLLHGDPTNRNSPCCPITAAQIRESGLDYLALGHIHSRGSFRGGDTLCGWPGCPMGRGWDETGEKGVYIVTLEDTARLEFLPLDFPRFHDLTVELDGSMAALEDALPVQSPDLFRVTLTGSGCVDAEAVRQKYSGLGWLEIRDETVLPTDPWAYMDGDCLLGTYFRLLHDQLETADGKQQQIIRLAAELSHRLIEGKEVQLP